MGENIVLSVLIAFTVISVGRVSAEERTETWISGSDPGQYDMTEALVRLNSRVLLSMRGVGAQSEPSYDLRFDLADRGIRVSTRYNRRERAGRFAYFLDLAHRQYGIRVSAGYFMPDIAMGMVFSGYDMTYPFSSGFPLRKYKRLVRRSSFYGNSVRGVALSAMVKQLYLMAFSGTTGKWSSDRYVRDDGRLGGLRVETSAGRIRSGLTFSFDNGFRNAGTDLRMDYGRASIALELAGRSLDKISGITGVRWKNRQGSAGIVIFCIDPDTDIKFGNIPGGREGYVASRRGYSLSATRRLRKSISGRFALGQTSYSNPDRLDWKNACRGEVSIRTSGIRITVGYVVNSTSSLPLMPLPPVGLPSLSTRRSVNILAVKGLGSAGRVRLSLRYPHDDESTGVILTQSFRANDKKKKKAMEVSFTWHQALRGRPSFYSYQPVLVGEYPWKYFKGDGLFWVISARREIGGITLSLRSSGGSQKKIGVDTQIRYDF
ncbi:MAG: hypothetical protein KOO63_04825 [Bacteroidales bacterium]|nr:hypothetical protein [Candidatus Latescibacterota bacterium]